MVQSTREVSVEVSDFVATVEIHRPPHNFFDVSLINQIADILKDLDEDSACRAIVLASEGKSFCAGANFGSGDDDNSGNQEFTEDGFRRRTGFALRGRRSTLQRKETHRRGCSRSSDWWWLRSVTSRGFPYCRARSSFCSKLRKTRHPSGFWTHGDTSQIDRGTTGEHDVLYG